MSEWQHKSTKIDVQKLLRINSLDKFISQLSQLYLTSAVV